MTSSVVQVQWCDTKLRISPPIVKQCYWNLAGMLHPTKCTRWYKFSYCYGNMLFLVSCFFKTKYYYLRLKKAKYLVLSKTHAIPPSLGLLFNIFNRIFYPVQLQMVIFDFKEEETDTERVAMATLKCVPSGIFRRVQHPCQVSIALLHYWRRNS